MFSKIYEKFLYENPTNYVDNFISKIYSAYHKFPSTNHVLTHLTENWEKLIDEKNLMLS